MEPVLIWNDRRGRRLKHYYSLTSSATYCCADTTTDISMPRMARGVAWPMRSKRPIPNPAPSGHWENIGEQFLVFLLIFRRRQVVNHPDASDHESQIADPGSVVSLYLLALPNRVAGILGLAQKLR